MPISTTILSHKYFNQFTNNEDFLANTSDFTENLAGSAIEAIKVVTQIEISWQAVASQSNPWTFLKNTGTDWTITRANGSFFDDGFWVSAYCFLDTVNGGVGNITIDTISNDGRILNVTADAPTGVADGTFDIFRLYPIASDASNLLTSLIYGFGIIGENETYNKLSKVSGNKQEYYFTPISASDVAGKAKGTYNDWVSGSSTCKSIVASDVYTQAFEIAHIFRVEPHYLDGDLDNLQDNVLPDLFNTNSLKYAFDVEFRIALSNPNKSIKATYESIKGSVGWYNQNFNGFDNDYQIESIVYEDSATTDSTDGLQISSKTKATITVSKLSGVLAVGQRAGVFVSYLPTQSEYQNTVTTLQENYLLDSLYHTEGDSAEVGTGVIKSLDSSIVSGNLVIVAEFEYTTAQQLRLTTESNYLLAVQMADSALSAGNSDRVNLIADVQSYQKGAFIEGLFNITDFGYLVNGQDLSDESALIISEIWNEDSIAVKGAFDLDLANEAFLERIEFALVAFNTVTNSYFLLDSYFLNTANVIVSGGSQQINISQSRGYTQVYESETFNTIDIEIGAKVGDLQGYTFNFAQKLKWQEWLFNSNADTVFFDSAEPQNNLNFKSSNYSGLNNYEIKVLVLANTTGLNDLGQEGQGRDLYEGGNITVKDYSLSDTTYTVATVATLDPDTLTDLNGAILSDKPTLLESRFSTGAIPVTTNKKIIHRYEKTNQLGDVLPELEATLTVDGTDLVGQTLLSNALFESGTSYNFTARLFNPFQIFQLELYTTWDTSTDGAFNPTLAGGTKTWIFGTDTATGDNPNYSGSYLDGTLKTVIVTSLDFSLINLVTLTDYKLTGVLDVSLLTGSPSFTAQAVVAANALNNSFTSIIAPSEPFSIFTITYYQGTDITLATDSNFRVNSCPNLETVTITGGTTNQIFLTSCPSLTSFTHLGVMGQGLGLTSTPNISDITITSGATTSSMNFKSILGSIDFGGYEINTFTSFVFGETGTTIASLDQAWTEIDRVATITGITRTIDGSRATAIPSSTSLTARNSLISKGYFLII